MSCVCTLQCFEHSTCKYTCMYTVHVHVLMRDEKEGRKKQSQANNKAKQHSTLKIVTFPLPRVRLEPTTLYTLHSRQSVLPLSYQGSSAGPVHVHVHVVLQLDFSQFSGSPTCIHVVTRSYLLYALTECHVNETRHTCTCTCTQTIVITEVSPILASMVGPEYQEMSSGMVDVLTRFSPVSPLHGT